MPHSGPMLGINIHRKHQGCFRERELSTKHFGFFNCGFVHILGDICGQKKKIKLSGPVWKNEQNLDLY